jgi:carbon storage regulator CsrA
MMGQPQFLQGGFLMLVLSRKPGESVCLGKDVVITVLEVNGRRVRLGIEAPAEVRVARLELALRKADAPPPERLLLASRER